MTRAIAKAVEKTTVSASVLGGRRKQAKRDPQAMQARILKAATKEFSDHGFGGARIDRIAKRARTVDRMLYYYFASKEGLYRAVLEQAYEELVAAQANHPIAKGDPVEELRTLIRYNWTHYCEHPELIRLFNTENLHLGKHIKRSAKVRKLALPVIAILQDLIDRGVASGAFTRAVDPVKLYITIASLGYFYVSNRYTLSQFLAQNLMQPARRESWAEHIADVVLSYLRSEKSD